MNWLLHQQSDVYMGVCWSICFLSREIWVVLYYAFVFLSTLVCVSYVPYPVIL